MIAQAIPAILLASAVPATLLGRRANNAVNKPMSGTVDLGVMDHRERAGGEQAAETAVALLADAAQLELCHGKSDHSTKAHAQPVPLQRHFREHPAQVLLLCSFEFHQFKSGLQKISLSVARKILRGAASNRYEVRTERSIF